MEYIWTGMQRGKIVCRRIMFNPSTKFASSLSSWHTKKITKKMQKGKKNNKPDAGVRRRTKAFREQCAFISLFRSSLDLSCCGWRPKKCAPPNIHPRGTQPHHHPERRTAQENKKKITNEVNQGGYSAVLRTRTIIMLCLAMSNCRQVHTCKKTFVMDIMDRNLYQAR
jgi:hypothetical protein